MRVTQDHTAIRMERIIPARPERVYREWLDPELLARWMVPGPYEVTRVEVDERVGGHYRIWQSHSGSEIGGFDCELVELVPSQRIDLSWRFVGPDRRLAQPAPDRGRAGADDA